MNYWEKDKLVRFSEKIYVRGFIQNLFCIFLNFLQIYANFVILNDFLGFN
jgi:hypothetical protein